jgi:hypothetical protein
MLYHAFLPPSLQAGCLRLKPLSSLQGKILPDRGDFLGF